MHNNKVGRFFETQCSISIIEKLCNCTTEQALTKLSA